MRSYHQRQAGGTVMGLIIGLIIGLMIAVWVAMTILKTPLPFVDKLVKQTQPAGDLGDPNKTLAGGARERREKLEQDEPSLPAPAAPVVSAKKLPEPAVLAEPAAAGKAPIVERSKTEKNVTSVNAGTAPEAAASANEEKFTYYLQAGAFREVADAESTKAKLAMMGVAATVAERRSELGALYRVRVGPFTEVEAMNRARMRLSDNGVDAAVVRVPK
jgi:cell division protein FtsN